MPQKRAAMVVGVGASAGLGAALGRRFAQEGLPVYLVGRTAQRLKHIATEIQASNGEAIICVADATSQSEIATVFDTVSEHSHQVDLVAYNVGRNIRVPYLDIEPTLFEDLWRQNCFGGFLVGQEAVRHMLPRGRGTIVFTGATASVRARPPFTGFAAAKAGLRAVALGLAREFGPKGIHVAHVVIDGAIDGEQVRTNFPDIAEDRGHDGMLQPDAIANAFWDLYCQKRSAWSHEIDLRPFQESF